MGDCSEVPERCGSCDAPMETPAVCVSCRTVFPEVGRADHFTRFGLPVAFPLDSRLLERRFLELSFALHPDRHTKAPAAEQRAAEERTARLNDAYQTLRDPVRRAEYLLELGGSAPIDGTDQISSPEFLMEMMEIKEQVEAASAANDCAALERLRRTLLERIDKETAGLGPALDPGAGTQQSAEATRSLLNRIAYLRRTLASLDNALLPS